MTGAENVTGLAHGIVHSLPSSLTYSIFSLNLNIHG